MNNRISLIQMTSINNIEHNLTAATEYLEKAALEGAVIAVLPEMFATLSVEQGHLQAREPFGNGPLQTFLSQQAKRLNLWIVGGTIPISCEDTQRVYAACLVFNNQGECVARYDKIHLYDASLENGNQIFQESAKTRPGTNAVVFDSPLGKIGLAVCFDLRFSSLFQRLREQEAEILIVPSAFVQCTGLVHWEILCRARAIETQCYFVGANQTGTHHGSRCSFGHSMLVDPWGKIIASLGTEPGVLTEAIDLDYLQKVRNAIPMSTQ